MQSPSQGMGWHPLLARQETNYPELSPLTVPIPDRATMEQRWKFRKSILRETTDHRSVHPHDGMAETRRNILTVLYDREKRSSRGLTVQLHRKTRREGSKGDRSPATVFDSPVSTTQTNLYDTAARDSEADDPASGDEELRLSRSVPQRKSYPLSISHEIQFFAEYCSVVKYHSAFLYHLGGDDQLDEEGNRPSSSRAVSTISVAFAPDGKTMASTHGDHTVKISCCHTGRLLQSLEGHPRTPWTVKYHPTDPSIIASGCLGHQVRVWNWVEKSCLQMVRLEFAIISLCFHPSGSMLAIANGTRLHFWGIDHVPPNQLEKYLPAPHFTDIARTGNRSARLVELDQRHMLRCVHFPPDGKTIIIGGVNPPTEDPRRRGRGGIGGNGMSFYLRLWDFDLGTALQPHAELPVGCGISIGRRAISNPRTFVPRALLYNDGGFDVSPDGKTLCACAEYWLPDGVDNAMELLYNEESAYEMESRETSSETEPLRSHSTIPSLTDTHSAVSAALLKLKGITSEARRELARSPQLRDGIDLSRSDTPTFPRTPQLADGLPTVEFFPRTPPIPSDQPLRLSPPSPPGRRFHGGLMPVSTNGGELVPEEPQAVRGLSTPPPPPPPPPPPAPGGITSRPPHPLSVIASMANYPDVAHRSGRFVPHVVTVSLDTSPIPPEIDHKLPRGKPIGAVAKGYRPRLGQLLEACPLDPAKASAVTCVKFSPSTDFCLIGYGVREPMVEGGGNFHPVTALYRVRGGMNHVSTMLSGDDDVNIARFHPDSGHGFVYGTKQGRVRVLSPRPWNFYNC